MEPLELTVPLQHDYTDPTVETDPARLAAWLSDLPLMNVYETVRLVCGALHALNEQRLDPGLRFRCLEVYRPTVWRLFETLEPLHLRQISMARAKRHETIATAAQLFGNLAGGYKLIVMDLRGRGDPLSGEAINRAVEALAGLLLDGYRFYRALPPWLVPELHRLYRAARHEGLLEIRVTPAEPVTAALYKYAMLLSLTDADRLAEGEVSLLADILRELAEHCRIVQGGSWIDAGAGLFLLDLAGEAPPRPCSGLQSPVTEGDPFLLDATEVLKVVRARLAEIPERVRQRSPEAIVLRQLSPAEWGAARRREARHQDGRWISLLPGLEPIHAWLSRASGKPVPGSREDTGEAVECRVIDRSEGGMKLFREDGEAGDARVGDLLGIIEDEDDRQALRLACIRSLRIREGGGMEAGVQIIASGLGPVSCALPDQPDAVAVRALFLPADEQAGISATLVAAGGLYQEGRSVVIDVGGREIRVRAGRLVSDSPVFDRFEFAAE